MKESFKDKLEVLFYTMDSEEAKRHTFKGSTAVLLDNEPVPLNLAKDKMQMEAFLSEKIHR